MGGKLSLIKSKYLSVYKNKQNISLSKYFNKIKTIDNNPRNFDFYFSGSAVYSSIIEGNRINFDSYLKYYTSGMNNKGKSFREIKDLKKAYKFAKDNQIYKSAFFLL